MPPRPDRLASLNGEGRSTRGHGPTRVCMPGWKGAASAAGGLLLGRAEETGDFEAVEKRGSDDGRLPDLARREIHLNRGRGEGRNEAPGAEQRGKGAASGVGALLVVDGCIRRM